MRFDRVPVAATFSKDARFWGKDFQPRYLIAGNGCLVKDNEGHEYIDWVSGLGANFLGHAHVGFVSHVNMWLRRGTAFSLPHMLEYTVAEKLTDMLAEHVSGWSNAQLQVRWVKEGSGACDAAVRLARAVTGKPHIISYGYHGWDETFVTLTPPAHGIVPDLGGYIHPTQFNDIASVEQYSNRDDIAAIIVEQPLAEPNKEWYPALRKFCDDHNALLIMDEVVTGLRYARGGASEMYAVKLDLMCTGKALGNGLPLGALIGPTEYMQWFSRNDPVFVSSTNAGDVASLAAADFVLDYVQNGKYLKHLYTIGGKLIDGLREAGWTVSGNAPRSLVMLESDAQKAFLISYLRDCGILLNRPNFPTMAHTEADVIQTVEAAHKAHNLWNELDDTEKETWIKRAPTVLFRNR